MPLRRLTFLASLVLAVATMSPPAALAAANGTDRPLTGTGTGTNTLNLATLAATAEATGHISHLGAFTGHFDAVFTITGASTFTYTGTGTDVAANGDKLFSTITGSGTLTSPTTAESTETDTITGGTGRFAGASGTYTETISSVIVSVTATTETSRFTAALKGQISY
jgi:hydroxyethylthiazole kinase-like sugar kinase family protein